MMHEVSAILIMAPGEEPMPGVLEPIKSQCSEIVIVRGRQRAQQRNEGLRRATSKYVLMVDSDQIIEANYVQKLLEPMSATQAGSVTGLIMPHPSLPPLSRVEELLKMVVELSTGIGPEGGTMYNKEAVFKAGAFPVLSDGIAEYGFELIKQMRRIGYETKIEPNAIVMHLKRYSASKLVEVSLTCATTRLTPPRLIPRIFSSVFKSLRYLRLLYYKTSDQLVYTLPIYSFLRQTLFFYGSIIRRIRLK